MGLKEQVRGQVQNELERLASGCTDMATLLRRLQIPVEGGPYPSPKQVKILSLLFGALSCVENSRIFLHYMCVARNVTNPTRYVGFTHTSS